MPGGGALSTWKWIHMSGGKNLPFWVSGVEFWPGIESATADCSICENSTCTAGVFKSSAPSHCRPWCNVLIQEWKRCLKWRYKDMTVNIQQVGKKLGCYFNNLTTIDPCVMLWLFKLAAYCICSGMLNRVYGLSSDRNCFAVTVTVSPCHTTSDEGWDLFIP